MSQYTLSGKTRNLTFAFMGIGVLALVYGALNHAACHDKTAASRQEHSNHHEVGWIFIAVGMKKDAVGKRCCSQSGKT